MKIKQFVEQKNILGVVTAVILIFTLILAKNTLAMPPSAVSLLSFTVTSQQNAALAEWETATELSAAGFKIERKQAAAEDEQFADISGFINAQGDVTVGAEYSYLDQTAVNGQTYIYRLMEWEAGGAINELERVQITIGAQPTATPITTGGGSNTATPRPTTPPTATARPSATATRSTAATATARTTAVSPTTVPTATPTRASGDNSTAVPTATRQNGTGANPTDSGIDIAFAQDSTPIPTTAAYPGEITTEIQPPPVSDSDYPAVNTEPASLTETATPYPIGSEVRANDNNDGSTAVNVIGSDATDGRTSTVDNVEENSSNGYLWFGFIVALLIFIAGVIGTAVLLVRKK